MIKFDKALTLEVLENEIWGKPPVNSHLAIECHRLRKIPVQDFTTENLRIMIGQKFSLMHLLPIALERLLDNPFLSGDYFKGDLLEAVLNVDKSFWIKNPALLEMLREVMLEVDSIIELNNESIKPKWDALLNSN